MNKTKKNFWLDVALFIAFISVTISSLVLDNRDPNLILWGLIRPAWGAVAMLGLMLVHLAWHWSWIISTGRRCLVPGVRPHVKKMVEA